VNGGNADASVVFDSDVASQDGAADNDLIADDAIVPDIGVAKNVIIRANARDFSVARRAIDARVFANGIVVAQFRPRDAALPFQILGFQADAYIRIKLVLFPDFGVPVNDNVGMKLAVFTECDVLTNDAKGADFATRAKFGFWMNNRRFMDHEDVYCFDFKKAPAWIIRREA
jgi:hypothetical protein